MIVTIEKEFEGCKLTAYQDSVGVWTNGWGNTHFVTPGSTITQAQADADLLENLKWAISSVSALVTSPLTEKEESALVDLVFNIGSGNFAHSTLLKLLNVGDRVGATAEFLKWDHAGGHVLAGLTRRRIAEAEMFKQGIA